MIAPSAPRIVCHFLERLDYGGAETLVHALATRMRGSNYQSIVCCLKKGDLAGRFERDGIPVHSLDLTRRSVLEGPRFIWFLRQLTTAFRRLVRSEHVAVVHAHLPDPIVWAAFSGITASTPLIGTYHGLGIMPRERGSWDPRNQLRLLAYRYAAARTDRTIAVSEPVRALLCGELHFNETKTAVVVNGIDTARLMVPRDSHRTRRQLGLEDRPVIVCVGRLIVGKGQRFLIDALPEVSVRFPTVTLILVGDGPERTAYESQARALGVSDRVRFAGQRDDVAELLAIADVFVLPSFAEGIPLALIEAMAAGKPVIATAVPGNSDVVVDDRYGMLVPPRDAHALAAAITLLLENPDRAAEMAKRGQARAHADFDVTRTIAATMALYDEVLAERSGQGLANRQ